MISQYRYIQIDHIFEHFYIRVKFFIEILSILSSLIGYTRSTIIHSGDKGSNISEHLPMEQKSLPVTGNENIFQNLKSQCQSNDAISLQIRQLRNPIVTFDDRKWYPVTAIFGKQKNVEWNCILQQFQVHINN